MGKSSFLCSLLLFFCFTPPEKVHAQSLITDSLQAIIDAPDVFPGERIEAMETLSRIMAGRNDLPRALDIARDALRLTYGEDEGKYAALMHSVLCYLHVQQDSLKLAYQAMDSAEWYASRSSDHMVQARVLFRRGWLEHIAENTEAAYRYMLEALRIFQAEGAEMYKSNIYHYLAAIHGYQGNRKKQNMYTRLCYQSAFNSGDPDAMANATLSMGNSFLYRFRNANDQKSLLDSAKMFYRAVLDISDSLQARITLPSTRGIAALNLANIYNEFYPPTYKDSARIFLNEALTIGRRLDHSEIIANSYGILSEYSRAQGDYRKAESLLLKGLHEMPESPRDRRYKARIIQALAGVAEQNGEPAKALHYYKRYMQFHEQLFDREKVRIVQHLEAQYQSGKKELELKVAKQKAAFNGKLNRYYLILSLAALIALFFLIRSFHFKLKSSRQQEFLLSSEKNQAELKAVLKGEESARLKAERQLMQERLDRLEKELLAGTLQVEEKNGLIKALKEKLGCLDPSDPLHRKVHRLLSRNQDLDADYDQLRTELAEVRPEFISALQARSGEKLTRLDLKYCAYILMGFRNKEIALKTNVDPKSIRMARYRIKQKLRLEKSESLDDFIHALGSYPEKGE